MPDQTQPIARPTRPDLTDPLTSDAFYADDPFPHYKRLRYEAPMVWHGDPGYWVASRFNEVQEISANSALFCSAKGILNFEIGIDYPTPPTMMHTDPPVHTAYRKRVANALRPSRIRALEPMIRERAVGLLDSISFGASTDVLHQLAVPFPLMVIADLLGVPRDDWPRFYLWSEATIPDVSVATPEQNALYRDEMHRYFLDVIHERRSNPTDDLISDLVGDGGLDDDESWMFVNQLFVAGNETSRNHLAGGLYELARHPAQWQLLLDHPELRDGAVEEMLRWTTPVIAFMRTATAATELAGRHIHAGDPIVMLYSSANRDESQFGPSADNFDVTRAPNHHIAFGFGAHFCAGAALARLEMRIMLDELAARVHTLSTTEVAERTESAIIAGWRRLELNVTVG